MIIFATNNKHKLQEIREILGQQSDIRSLAEIGCHEDIPETGQTLEENAWQKADYIYQHYGPCDCFADDTGLEVEALGGEPGVHSARYAEGTDHDSNANMDKLLHKLEGKANRQARFRTVIALIHKGERRTFEGEVRGHIDTEKHGSEGFGYDPIFVPEGHSESFAQMGEEAKNQISHRARAVAKLAEYLKQVVPILLFCLLQLLPVKVKAQVGTWQVYPAYSQPTKIVPAGKLVYVLASQDLYVYNTEDQSIQAFDRLNGLSSFGIQDIDYSSSAGRLIVVYGNGNIDLIDNNGNTQNLPDYYNKSMTEDKTVNQLSVVGNNCYMATNFGIVKVNMQRAEISETYYLDVNVNQATEDKDGNLYALAKGGMMRAMKGTNMIDKQNWQVINPGTFKHIFNLDGQLYLTNNGYLWRLIRDNTAASTIGQIYYTNAYKFGNTLACCGADASYVVDAKGNITTLSQKLTTLAPASAGGYWTNDSEGALQRIVINDDKTQTVMEHGLKPDGPKYNYFGFLRYGADRLYSVGGGYTSMGDKLRAPAIQILQDGNWTILPDNLESTIGHKYLDLLSIDYDPHDPDHVMVGARGGLYEFKNGVFVKEYNYDNSPLGSAVSSPSKNYTLVEDAAYAKDGTLWVLNSHTNNGSIFTVSSDGKWNKLFAEKDQDTHYRSLLFDDANGLVWFVNNHWVNPALLCYQPATGGLNRYTSFVNEDGTAVNVLYVRCVTKDLEGNLWIGTAQGPLMLEAQNIGQEPYQVTFTQVKVPRNDGTNLADYLLSGVDISCIAVDGGGRKWFGTNGNGAYLVSADNMEQLQHFTSENSPLPSNDVESIAINGKTGDVYFGTGNGLCSYRSDATDTPEKMDKDNVYAYPNPVRPDYDGPITITGLTLGARITITTSNGVKVAEGISNGGTFTWDGRDLKGRKVASGVYMVLAATAGGDKGVVCKVAIVR